MAMLYFGIQISNCILLPPSLSDAFGKWTRVGKGGKEGKVWREGKQFWIGESRGGGERRGEEGRGRGGRREGGKR
jgi:hypothetical protein